MNKKVSCICALTVIKKKVIYEQGTSIYDLGSILKERSIKV